MHAYNIIREFYAERTAVRSKQPLIAHIDEGLKILTMLGESEYTKRAFCIHPMLQNDADLSTAWRQVADAFRDDGITLMLAMEYRSVANEFLSDKSLHIEVSQIRLSPIRAVNNMLIADKIQNRKDFEKYNQQTHPRSDELSLYFKLWLDRLEVSETTYQAYVKALE